MKKLSIMFLVLFSLSSTAQTPPNERLWTLIKSSAKEINAVVTEVYDEELKFSLKHKVSEYKISYKVVNEQDMELFEMSGFRFDGVDYFFNSSNELIAAINAFRPVVKDINSVQGIRTISFFCEPIFNSTCLYDRIVPTRYYDIDTIRPTFYLLYKDGSPVSASWDPEVPTSRVK